MAAANNARPVAEILRACERARAAAAPGGPGWSVCFKDRDGRSIALLTLGSYDQVDHLAREVVGLGYHLTVLDAGVQESDFVFRAAPSEEPPLLHTPPPAPAIAPTPRARLPIAQGDLVVEEYGGPIMLVRTTSRDLAYCVWLSEGAHMSSGTFTLSRLVNVSGARRHGEAAGALDRLLDAA